MLQLPDRYPLLYLLDDIPDRVQRRRSMLVRGGDPNTYLAEAEHADSVLHHHRQTGDCLLYTSDAADE